MLWSTIRNYSQRTGFKYPFIQTRVTTTLAFRPTRDPHTLRICETVLLQGVLFARSGINGTRHPFQEESGGEQEEEEEEEATFVWKERRRGALAQTHA